MDLNGVDLGQGSHIAGNFGWGTLDLDSGNSLNLTGDSGDTLYFTDLTGAEISGNIITNITGLDGLTIYYDGRAAGNSYLGNLTYNLMGGGKLISSVPEPESWVLMILGFGVMGVAMRRRKAAALATV
jgi:hypothetical protein